MGQDQLKWFENLIRNEKNCLNALAMIGNSLKPDEGGHHEGYKIDDLTRNMKNFVTSAYSNSSTYATMIREFVNKCRREIKKKTVYYEEQNAYIVEMVSDSISGPPQRYWLADNATAIVDILEGSITWTQSKLAVKSTSTQSSPSKSATHKEQKQETKKRAESTIHVNVQKRVLGVLKSFPRISISDLSKYSGESEDTTRDMLFEMIGDNLVSGRFDIATDEFISAHAAIASREIKADAPSLARCMYCGKSLERALISGDEIACPSCGMVNVG